MSGMRFKDQVHPKVLAHLKGCCGPNNGRWNDHDREHLCDYHDGMNDGLEMAEEGEEIDLLIEAHQRIAELEAIKLSWEKAAATLTARVAELESEVAREPPGFEKAEATEPPGFGKDELPDAVLEREEGTLCQTCDLSYGHEGPHVQWARPEAK